MAGKRVRRTARVGNGNDAKAVLHRPVGKPNRAAIIEQSRETTAVRLVLSQRSCGAIIPAAGRVWLAAIARTISPILRQYLPRLPGLPVRPPRLLDGLYREELP